jgi:hypothetical protein
MAAHVQCVFSLGQMAKGSNICFTKDVHQGQQASDHLAHYPCLSDYQSTY